MGLFGFLKTKEIKNYNSENDIVQDSPDSFADASSISPEERPFYQPDNYYTYYSYSGTHMSSRVTTFEERKKISYPSSKGLYVGEIMLLDYCDKGTYPKPKGGYPGFWWFEYGIRDIGHALESLEKRGFIQWASKVNSIKGLKSEELKQILTSAGLPVTGKKADLINRIKDNIPEDSLSIPEYVPKYELTELGKAELNDNGYVPYMRNHSHRTTENDTFGPTFTVWDINKLFPNGDASNWRKIVGDIEKKRFGVDMANATPNKKKDTGSSKKDNLSQREEIRGYLRERQAEIKQGIMTPGDGYEEEAQGLDLKSIGEDKEALVKFYISIGKGFDAPALYRETTAILRKYGMYEEEILVIDAGIKNLPDACKEDLIKKREKAQTRIKKNQA